VNPPIRVFPHAQVAADDPRMMRRQTTEADQLWPMEDILMHPYPHTYVASASGSQSGSVLVNSGQLPTIDTAPPPQFDGPGGVWSPEILLCASLADCFVLTFRALSRMARLEWLHVEARVEGLLERIERVSQFTRFTTHAKLVVPPGTDPEKARSMLARAEHECLISNSVRGERMLHAEVEVAQS
jgi:organic hydroperoxide reductase OsmC/OhrA